MKTKLLVIYLIMSALLPAQGASRTVPKDAVRQMCEEIQARYPVATLQDVYKTCYQDFFGAEHMMRDTAAARQYLHFELENCAELDLSAMPLREPTGFRHRYVRVNLLTIIEGQMTEEELLARFIEAANSTDSALPASAAEWENEWQQIEAIALQVNPDWHNEELQALLREAAKNKQAVHHSEPMRNAYNLHYRIIKQ